MKTVLPLVFVALAAPAFASEDAAAAAALKKLEAARQTVAAAVKKAEIDPPATADLDAALAALNTLKDAVDAAAPHEGKDLELAKAVLAARKELRTSREYVEGRKANIKVHEARRQIDGALGTLKETGKRIEASGAGAKDFEDARAAGNVVKKLADDNRGYIKQDPKFGTYLGEVDAAVAKHFKTIDERGLKILVEKAKGELKSTHKDFNDAVGRLTASSKDDEFKEADSAGNVLAKILETNKDLEGKDAGYKGDAEKARKDYATGKKKADDLWSQSGVERLKGEIEPAHKDLQAALKNLRSGKPTDDQLAEAKTVATVVKKLLEKFAPDAKRSKAFADYVENVRKTLTEVEVVLLKKGIGAVKADAVAALRAVEKKGSTKEQFDTLVTALTVYEKTLDAAPKDPAIAAEVSDGKTFIKDARSSMARKFIDNARADATAALRNVEKKGVTEEQFGELNTALTVLEKTIESTPKDPAVTATVTDAKTFVKDAKATIAKRRQEVEVQLQKGKVEEAKKKANDLVKGIAAQKITAEELAEAENGVKQLEAVLVEGAALAKKDGDYKAYDADTKKRIAELKDRIVARRKAQAAADLKASLQAAVADTTTKVEAALAPSGTDAQLDTATKAFEDLGKMIDGQAQLERNDANYAAAADKARNQTFKLLDKLQLAQMARELRRGTGDALAEGDKAAKQAEGTGDLKAKKKLLDNAASQYRACEKDGRVILSRYQQARLETKVQVLLDGQPAAPKDVVAACTARAEKAEAGSKETVPMIAFTEGPKKAYEAAKAAGNKGDKLQQLNECVTTGVILGNRSPELKERKLAVAGTELTLAELIATCQSERKALGGK